MKSEYLSKKPAPGFNANTYAKKSVKLGKDFQKKTKIVKHNAFQSKDMRSSSEWTTRTLPAAKSKATVMTYGGSDKKGKGTTIYKKIGR